MSYYFESEVKKNPSFEGIIWIDSERVSGTPCFYGTRVPVKHLFDYLEGGESIDDFLEGFDGVTREQVMAVLEAAKNTFIEWIIQK
jgi:uncharacterized protein (DUF433 family)